jgi:hypothetical protein
MLTIKYVNIPPAARSTKFRQKAKSTLKLPKWVDGQAGAENQQKAAENFRGLDGAPMTATWRGKIGTTLL